ncbi:glutamate synthase-related protein [Fictibacillus fluitans]|uniref:Glutamate synthase-related protein n=1 Tax=Fictibacillus fluitans TaxID=3058422 RepID=A0ABT8I3I4_9BACL|nr:glutamate synthase-related protein [Fictibacillus sp. NE201]MDN4527595.1 glutamate synthase-related protein [Fictibacillus sp. NE201]
MGKSWSPAQFKDYRKQEFDSCGIVSVIEKENIPTKKNVDDAISALITMNHRAGFIENEGDGIGINIDIPKSLWKEKLTREGLPYAAVQSDQFTVGHIFIDKNADSLSETSQIKKLFETHGFELLFETTSVTKSEALGPIARGEEPVFWQVALHPEKEMADLDCTLYNLLTDIEVSRSVHVASLSNHHAVYKVMGSGETLPAYYDDLNNPLIASTVTLGHNRYSTNTLSTFFRVQPFSVLGHNGELNTIAKLREEAEIVGIPVTAGGSDSQDLNRVIETLILRDGFTLFEAMDVLFPPIVHEIKSYPEHLQDLYTYLREAWGHFAQGPAGIISRFGREAVFSVDALGLRPIWQLETESSLYFSSEQGILSNNEFTAEPKCFAPGEKVGLKREDDGRLVYYNHNDYQEAVFTSMKERIQVDGAHKQLNTPAFDTGYVRGPLKKHNGWYSAYGWDREQIHQLEQMAEKGVEPIQSLGHDSPLAALHPERQNIADFIKESVAVVTNPAIDRDRETEHFSTRTVLGKRPSLFEKEESLGTVELLTPLLVEGKDGNELSKQNPHPSYEQLGAYFEDRNEKYILHTIMKDDETVEGALKRLCDEAAAAVKDGATILILDDNQAHRVHLWLDPHLVLSAVDQSLRKQMLRRSASLILRSAAIRSLHDIILAIGLGADAISPYLLFETVTEPEDFTPAIKLFEALNKGLEKVISTIGIHELRGYDRLFSSIGLSQEIAETLNIVNFFGSENLSYNFSALKEDSLARMEVFKEENARPSKSFRLFPRIWKSIGDIASGKADYRSYADKLSEQELKNPIALRHLTDLVPSQTPVDPAQVDVGVKDHSLPFVISSMSFGSQNETAFRAYAEAADVLNMISLNGEGGEIKDMIGKYPKTRGQQIASGRFGVNIELLNSSNLLEIKIGQGAKPGEGGHLPGSKVTDKIAEARNATIGSDLISPSNNHDIYSIEDLAQMITELKTANDQAKVSVKVPVVPNIGTIAVGIAKAGADIITLSGFDGGTGAARVHALQHVGLPAEIGVKAAHTALLESGLRHKVEIWADGGIRSALDAVKMMLLGANRIGFGTLSMVAIGCTTCRGCHLDTCHVGIATQIDSEQKAIDHGLRRFVPRQFDPAVQGLVRLFSAFGEELRLLTASLGFSSAQELVGKSDLLVQVRGQEQIDLSTLLQASVVEEMVPVPQVEEKLLAAVTMAAGAEYLDNDVAQLAQSRDFQFVTAEQRVLGSRVSGHNVRSKQTGKKPDITLTFKNGSIPGNGLGAYTSKGIKIKVEGGAQDGLAKTAFGGSITILKAKGKDGNYYNGSVGKGFAYGAQKGLFMIQGNADARAGIRLSGADLVIGGKLAGPVVKGRGNVGINANIKGFAFEYMTNGRGIVLGDPGPWICAGMTGGVVYLRLQPELGLTTEVLQSRIAKGAKVTLEPIGFKGAEDISDLLAKYMAALVKSEQFEEAAEIKQLLEHPLQHFVQVIPVKEQADPDVSTE